MQISTEKFPIPYPTPEPEPELQSGLQTGPAAKAEAGAVAVAEAGAVAGAVAVAVAGAWPADMDYAGSITIYSAMNRKSSNVERRQHVASEKLVRCFFREL